MNIEYLQGGLVIRGEHARAMHALLPTISRLVLYEGEQVCVMRHTPDTDRVLKNVGAVCDSAILRDPNWHWPGLHVPWEHQRATASFMTVNDRGFVLNDPGTGKTGASIWACEYLFRQEGGATLIIAPLTTLRSVWVKELFTIAPGARVEVVQGDAAKREAACKRQADYYVINHDGIKHSLKWLLKIGHIKRIIVDEATAFKNATSDRWKALHQLVRTCRLWLMTGTPMSQSPEDAYALVKLVSPHRVPATFSGWSQQVMLPVSKFVKVPRREAVGMVYDAMQPAIRFSKQDCIDLPDVNYVDMDVQVTAEQSKMMDQLKADFVAETKAGAVVAANAAVRMSKLLQVLQGAVRIDENTIAEVDAEPRLAALVDICRQSDGKTITFVNYTASIELVANRLRKEFGKEAVAVINGDVTGFTRDAIITSFQAPGCVLRHLVAHPKTAAHGLTLTEANTTTWFGPVMSNEQYVQGNARTDRAGQKRKSTVYHLIGTPLEREIFTRLRSSLMNQTTLLALYEDEITGVIQNVGLASTASNNANATASAAAGAVSAATKRATAQANSNRAPRAGYRPGAQPFFTGRRGFPPTGR